MKLSYADHNYANQRMFHSSRFKLALLISEIRAKIIRWGKTPYNRTS